jgi:hypothetical protein
MNPFEMVLGIVIVVTVGRVLSARFGGIRRGRHLHGAHDVAAALTPDPDTNRMRDEIRTLKERIAVLERIATDTSSAVELDREIEKLR